MKFDYELYSKIESLIISYTINSNETAGQLTRKILNTIKKEKNGTIRKRSKRKNAKNSK